MSNFSERFTAACISSTLVIFFYAVLGDFGIVGEIDNQTVYQLLIINFVIAIAMYFTDQLPVKNIYVCMAVNVADIFIVVFLLGGAIWGLFPLSVKMLAVYGSMILVVYFLVFGILLLRSQADVNCINKKIMARRVKK